MITSAYLQTEPIMLLAGTASASKAVTVAYFCNQLNVEVTINLYVAPSGYGSIQNHKIYNTLKIPSMDTVIVDTEKIILGNGDEIWADTTYDNAVVATLSTVNI